MVTIAVTSEAASEPRVAISPEAVKKYVGLGAQVRVEAGAGLRSRFSDEALAAAGATITSRAEALAGADFLLSVRRPSVDDVKALKPGAIVCSILSPYDDKPGLDALVATGASLMAMEFIPRITRAQSMDVLSSQANLAGYKAVVDAAAMFGQALPMMMTAAGTVPAAKIFIMGVGVAGLQAIATARRLGAIVSATDVRPATKEQVASLGAIQNFGGFIGAAVAPIITGAVLAATGSFTGVFVIGGILLIVGALSYGLFVKDRSQAA